jgi:DNA-binding winged helix-turn-helix (wHTH) protein
MAHGDRSVDVFVRKLRRKLEKLSAGWEYIHTHFGVGYRFEPEVTLEGAAEDPAAIEAVEPIAQPEPETSDSAKVAAKARSRPRS